jgi:hypothetical protein
MEFRWIDWNINHVADHGVEPQEVEDVMRAARPPYPQSRPDNKFMVWGRGSGG